MRNLFLFLFLFLALLVLSVPSEAKSIAADSTSAVILAYHRIGEDAFPDTNLRIEQFQEHIKEITDGSYNVIALPILINALKNKEILPKNTVAITFEGGYRSPFNSAMPLLLKNEIPFTVFFSSDQADAKSKQYLSWNALNKLKNSNLVTLGILPASYTRMAQTSKANMLQQINKARSKYREHFSSEAELFSYPFGEYNQDYRELIQEQGFSAAFGLQSGAVYAGSNLYSLPRFTMTESYGNLERFQMVAQSLPLPVFDQVPSSSLLDNNTPVIGFTLEPGLESEINKLSCFISGVKDFTKNIISNNRVELRLNQPLPVERTRVNCTIPGPKNALSDIASWRWHGMLLIEKNDSEKVSPVQPVLP